MILVLALLIGVLFIMQGLLGIVAPDAFVGAVRFFQTPSMIYVAAALRDNAPPRPVELCCLQYWTP